MDEKCVAVCESPCVIEWCERCVPLRALLNADADEMSEILRVRWILVVSLLFAPSEAATLYFPYMPRFDFFGAFENYDVVLFEI